MEAVADAQRQQLLVQADGLRAQLINARHELTQIDAQIATRNQQAKIANETLESLRRLESTRYVSVLQIKQQQTAGLEYTSQIEALRQQAASTQRAIVQLQEALAELPGQHLASAAALQRDLAQLELERVQTQAQGALAVSSPVSGVVSASMVKPGQAVQVGQSLLTLLPGDGTLEAELLVPSRAIGFIRTGDRVLLRYQAYPYQKFGHQQGWVRMISRSALKGDDLSELVDKSKQTEPYYRVVVTLARQNVLAYGRFEQLKPGMLLEADILGERRRLIEWVFDPLYSIKGGNLF